MRTYRRSKKFIRPDLQLKIVFIALFVASLVLLINFQMSLTTIWGLASEPPATIDMALDQMRHELVMKFLISVGLAFPLSISVGILYSFKFSGPIYRFKKYCNDLTTGRWDTRCALRKGDDLWDVCDAINGAISVLRDRVQESHLALAEARAVLEEASYTVDENGKARIAALRERIEREDRVWNERFPAPVAPAAVSAQPAPQPETSAHAG